MIVKRKGENKKENVKKKENKKCRVVPSNNKEATESRKVGYTAIPAIQRHHLKVAVGNKTTHRSLL